MGSGKSTLAAGLAAKLGEAGRPCWCIGADSGSPAFGPPGAVSLARWQGGAWQTADLEALCSLDAGRQCALLVSDVFISHAHMDHIGGFLWLLRSRVGPSPACRLYGPPGLADNIAGMIRGVLGALECSTALATSIFVCWHESSPAVW
jgi:glyoxylase-like metal-dependent hydrolase (beta-lactamase superfamily II)